MNAIKHINKILFIVLSLAFLMGCDDNESNLQLSGDTWLKSLVIVVIVSIAFSKVGFIIG